MRTHINYDSGRLGGHSELATPSIGRTRYDGKERFGSMVALRDQNLVLLLAVLFLLLELALRDVSTVVRDKSAAVGTTSVLLQPSISAEVSPTGRALGAGALVKHSSKHLVLQLLMSVPP